MPKDSACIGTLPAPMISSVERPPMSITSRGCIEGCSRATPL